MKGRRLKKSRYYDERVRRLMISPLEPVKKFAEPHQQSVKDGYRGQPPDGWIAEKIYPRRKSSPLLWNSNRCRRTMKRPGIPDA